MRKLAVGVWLVGCVLGGGRAQAEAFQGVDGQRVELAAPKRVVAINASLVEILFGLGRGDTLVGTDVGGTHPPEQAKLPKVGHPYHPSVEGIIGLKPDLVLATEENMPSATAAQLRGARVPVLVLENSTKDGLEGLKRRIDVVARLMGAQEAGQRMIQDLDTCVAALGQRVAAVKTKPRILFLYTHGPGEASVYGRDTGAHVLITLVGGDNAVAFTPGVKTINAESLVEAAPDVILMLNRGLEAVGGLDGALKLPGVALTPAGRNKKIVAMDDTLRWVGPRFPQFAETLFSAIHAQPRP